MATAQQSLLEALQARSVGGGSRLDRNSSLGQLRGMAQQEENQTKYDEVINREIDPYSEEFGVAGAKRANLERMEDLARARAQEQSLEDQRHKGVLDVNALRQRKAQEELERNLDPAKRAEYEYGQLVTKLKKAVTQSQTDKLKEMEEAKHKDRVYIDPFNAAAISLGMLDQMPKEMNYSPELMYSKVHGLLLKHTNSDNVLATGEFGQEMTELANKEVEGFYGRIKAKAEAQQEMANVGKIKGETSKLVAEAHGEMSKSTSGPGLSPSVVTDLQKQSLNAADLANKFGNIAEMFKPELFNHFHVTKVKGLMELQKTGVKLSAAQLESINNLVSLRTQVVQLFNAYRKDITGAAASNQELARLEKGFVHMAMSPTEFMVAVRGLQSIAQMQAAFKAKVATHGIDFAITNGVDYLNTLRRDGPKDKYDQAYLAAAGKWEQARGLISRNEEWDNLAGPELNESGMVDNYGELRTNKNPVRYVNGKAIKLTNSIIDNLKTSLGIK